MLELIKKALRITHNALDAVLLNDIDAALKDMNRLGVNEYNTATDDPLIIKCVELYVKWQEDFNNDGERFREAYERMRDGLSMSEGYTCTTTASSF